MKLEPEQAAIAKQLWKEGKRTGEIVNHFGGIFTRNQIIGKLYRMGALGYRYRPRSESMRPRKSLPKSETARPASPVFRMPTPSDASLRSFNDISGPSYDLIDLRRLDCHWPIGDPGEEGFCWCAAPVSRGPYCYHHTKLAVAPPLPRR